MRTRSAPRNRGPRRHATSITLRSHPSRSELGWFAIRRRSCGQSLNPPSSPRVSRAGVVNTSIHPLRTIEHPPPPGRWRPPWQKPTIDLLMRPPPSRCATTSPRNLCARRAPIASLRSSPQQARYRPDSSSPSSPRDTRRAPHPPVRFQSPTPPHVSQPRRTADQKSPATVSGLRSRWRPNPTETHKLTFPAFASSMEGLGNAG